MLKTSIKRKILIYENDPISTSRICVEEAYQTLRLLVDPNKYEIKKVDSQFLKNENWIADTVLLVIPGGRARPHFDHLQQAGNQKIIEFVNSGGNYLGICAGGYYGARSTVFEKNGPLEVIEMDKGPLFFYSGIAEGPAYGLGEFKYDDESGSRLAQLSYQFPNGNRENLSVYYNGGCFFHGGENKNTTVLARYLDIPNRPAAIVACKVGKGLAILSGVHFEYRHSAENLQGCQSAQIKQALLSSASKRKNLVVNLFSRLSIT